MAKYVRDYEYKGELTRLRGGRYEYVLNERKYHIRTLPWVLYGCKVAKRWEARSGNGFFESANTLSIVVRNIDRRES